MGFVEAVQSSFQKFFVIKGRACRSEYWFFGLFYLIVYAVMGAANEMLGLVFEIGMFIPLTTVWIRRFHDIGMSGWWILLVYGLLAPLFVWGSLGPEDMENTSLGMLGFILATCIISLILWIKWAAKAGDEGENQYGPNPLTKSENIE